MCLGPKAIQPATTWEIVQTLFVEVKQQESKHLVSHNTRNGTCEAQATPKEPSVALGPVPHFVEGIGSRERLAWSCAGVPGESLSTAAEPFWGQLTRFGVGVIG